MNNLIIKPVDVLGSSIMAAKDADGSIWVGINSFCQGLDMNKKQRDWQVKKIKEDKTLSRGCRLLPAAIFDPSNEAYALRLDFIPIWLSKITITKKMEQEMPDLADKLLEYQLKAKDILAAAFLPKPNMPKPAFDNSTGTKIKLYKNNQWGILNMGGELYNLTPDEFELVSRLIPALDKNGVRQVPLVITTMLGLSGRSGKLEYIGTYRCHNNE